MYIYISLGIAITLFSIFGIINKRNLVDRILFILTSFTGLILLLSAISIKIQNVELETFIYLLVAIFSVTGIFGIGLIFNFIKFGKNIPDSNLESSEEYYE